MENLDDLSEQHIRQSIAEAENTLRDLRLKLQDIILKKNQMFVGQELINHKDERARVAKMRVMYSDYVRITILKYNKKGEIGKREYNYLSIDGWKPFVNPDEVVSPSSEKGTADDRPQALPGIITQRFQAEDS